MVGGAVTHPATFGAAYALEQPNRQQARLQLSPNCLSWAAWQISETVERPQNKRSVSQ
jgi:hypothetical protein